mgnify:CR=1 FL=1
MKWTLALTLLFCSMLGTCNPAAGVIDSTFTQEEENWEVTLSVDVEVDKNPYLVRALWSLARSVFTGWITRATYDAYVKPVLSKRISAYSNEMNRAKQYSTTVSNAHNHITKEWSGMQSGSAARNHLGVCSVCRTAFNDITRGSGFSFSRRSCDR